MVNIINLVTGFILMGLGLFGASYILHIIPNNIDEWYIWPSIILVGITGIVLIITGIVFIIDSLVNLLGKEK